MDFVRTGFTTLHDNMRCGSGLRECVYLGNVLMCCGPHTYLPCKSAGPSLRAERCKAGHGYKCLPGPPPEFGGTRSSICVKSGWWWLRAPSASCLGMISQQKQRLHQDVSLHSFSWDPKFRGGQRSKVMVVCQHHKLRRTLSCIS